MIRTILVVLIAFSCNNLFAQTSKTDAGKKNKEAAKDSIPKYQQLATIPPFKIMLSPDSTAFTKEDLKKGESTIIMVFSPDCDHCIHSTKDLLEHYKELKDVQIVMSTALAYDHLQKFYKEYAIGFYPAIKMGLDNSYALGTFYQVRMYPFIVLYDKNGHYKQTFDGNTKWEDIAKAL